MLCQLYLCNIFSVFTNTFVCHIMLSRAYQQMIVVVVNNYVANLWSESLFVQILEYSIIFYNIIFYNNL